MKDYIEIAEKLTADLSYIDFRNSEGMEKAFKMIRMVLLEVMRPNWISVKEKLPKQGETVVIWRPSQVSKVQVIKWWFDLDEIDLQITHWMKPEPPEKEAGR